MNACTFFGHKDCSPAIIPLLEKAIVDLVVNHDVRMFYVGNQGQFDAYARRVLRGITETYPQVSYAVVLAYMPCGASVNGDSSDTMLPEGIERIHPRYAISWRNRWVLAHAGFVIAYVTHSWGGAVCPVGTQTAQTGIEFGSVWKNGRISKASSSSGDSGACFSSRRTSRVDAGMLRPPIPSRGIVPEKQETPGDYECRVNPANPFL